jgi:hypothetical protein
VNDHRAHFCNCQISFGREKANRTHATRFRPTC